MIVRKLLERTVFNPIGGKWSPDRVLAILFHRSAATLYLIYGCWGLVSIFGSIPTLVHFQGDVVQLVFSFLVMPMSFCAFVGALFFPAFARIEMFSAASLVTLVTIYEVFVFIAFLQGDVPHGVGFVLNLSHLVIPIARIVFIYVTLIKQAGDG